MGKIKVLIVDDHPITREGLKRILEDAPDMEVAGEAATGAEAMDLLRSVPVQVVLLDIGLGEKSGLEVLSAIRNHNPEIKVLMLSMYPEDQYALRTLHLGASGYLTKESAPAQLLVAVRRVAAGGKSISATVAERLAWDVDKTHTGATHELLSNREFEVLRMIGAGKTVTQIAETLHLSVKTVSTYRQRILDKMQMKTNAELTYYAVKHGLVI
jgi:two-component system, NarL family, invasion response regulator UvrY